MFAVYQLPYSQENHRTINLDSQAKVPLSAELKWKFKTGGSIWSSPVIVNSTILFGGCDQYFYALDIKTGTVQWKYKTNGMIHSSPSVFGDMVLFRSDDHFLYALDAESGNLNARFETGGKIYASPTIYEDIVYVGSEDGCCYVIEIVPNPNR